MKTLKEKIEIMQAYERGEQIERYYDNEWVLCKNPIWNWEYIDYRIKPKTKYVPFETAEEFLVAQKNKGSIIIDKKSGTEYNIFINGNNNICFTNINLSNFFGTLQKIFDEFTFADGTPCGKEVAL